MLTYLLMTHTQETAQRSNPEDVLAGLLSECKQWRQATQQRLRLINHSSAKDTTLSPDRRLMGAIEVAEESLG